MRRVLVAWFGRRRMGGCSFLGGGRLRAALALGRDVGGQSAKAMASRLARVGCGSVFAGALGRAAARLQSARSVAALGQEPGELGRYLAAGWGRRELAEVLERGA